MTPLRLLLRMAGGRLLRLAPRLSVRLAARLSGNPKLAAYATRPLMVQRLGHALLNNGILIAQLNVTHACNEKCPMCNLWEEGSRMPLDRAKLCMDRIADLGSFILTITGGEPFTHPDIGDIIDYAHEKQFFLNLNTNASLPLKVYRRADLNKIDLAIVSFHAMDERKLERVTGVRNTLPKVLDTLKYFRDETSMRVILKFVVQRDNADEIEKVQEFADREGFAVEYHPVMVDKENRPVTSDNIDLLPTAADQVRTIETIMELKRKGRQFEAGGYYQFCLDAAKRSSYQWKCDARKVGPRGLIRSFRPHRARSAKEGDAETLSPLHSSSPERSGGGSGGCDAGINYLSVYPDGRFGICKDVYTSARITDDDFIQRYRSADFEREMAELRGGCRGCTWSCYYTASRMAAFARDPSLRELRLLRAI